MSQFAVRRPCLVSTGQGGSPNTRLQLTGSPPDLSDTGSLWDTLLGTEVSHTSFLRRVPVSIIPETNTTRVPVLTSNRRRLATLGFKEYKWYKTGNFDMFQFINVGN